MGPDLSSRSSRLGGRLLLGLIVAAGIGCAGTTGTMHAPAPPDASRAASAACPNWPQARVVHLNEVGDDPSKEGRWQSDAAAKGEDLWGMMEIRVVDRHIRRATYWETTPSRDWEQTTTYCFRIDGSLEAMESDLVTFHGDVRVQCLRHVDPGGRVSDSTCVVADLKTGKPVDPAQRSFMAHAAPVFPSARAIVDEVGAANVSLGD